MLQDAKTENSIILALECSGNAASAALMVDRKITGFQEHKARHGHAGGPMLLRRRGHQAGLAGIC